MDNKAIKEAAKYTLLVICLQYDKARGPFQEDKYAGQGIYNFFVKTYGIPEEEISDSTWKFLVGTKDEQRRNEKGS